MIKLRDYQLSAVKSVFKEWEDNQSTMILLATGTGKTTIFTEIIRRSLPKRCLILVHREELLFQAKDRLLNQAGIESEIEMGNMKASTYGAFRASVVIATVQSLYSGERMLRFNPSDFGILIADELHHYVSPSYKKVVDYFCSNKDLKFLGVTATGDRSDEEALGQIVNTCAFDYEILDAIHDGYLVPVEQQMIHVEGLDFSNVRTTAGDLNGGDLAEIMEREQVLQGIASSSIDIIGSKRSLAFTASVKHAEMLCNIFNRHRPGMADWICGTTPKDIRRSKIEAFRDGKIQIMTNCGIFTEGTDFPFLEAIIQGRPTKSRSLYAQIIGRGLRPLPGIIDGLETKEERLTAIASSKKPFALILDFVGNAGRHKLMTSADILGGNVSDKAVERAIERAKESGGSVRMDELLDEEEENVKREEMLEKMRQAKLAEAARRSKLVAKANYTASKINPFDAFQLEPQKERGWDSGKTLSDKQKAILQKQGIDPSQVTYSQGKQVLVELFRRWDGKLCSMKQANLLNRHGYDTKEMTMDQASKYIDALAKNNWKRPVEITKPTSSVPVVEEDNIPF